MTGKAQSSRKLQTIPINPDTSTSEKPIKDHRIKLLVRDGLRLSENNKKEKILEYDMTGVEEPK